MWEGRWNIFSCCYRNVPPTEQGDIKIKQRCVAPRSNDSNMCKSFHNVISTYYIICNLQIVDIYQNIRPGTKALSENQFH